MRGIEIEGYRERKTDSDLRSGEGLWPPERCSNFAYAAYICICVRLSHSSPLPSLSFPCYRSLPPSLQRGFASDRRSLVATPSLPPLASRGFASDRHSLVATPSLPPASDRPLATIWYRSAAFLRDDLRNQNRKLYVKIVIIFIIFIVNNKYIKWLH